MTDFIEVYDEALASTVCSQLIARFEASKAVVRGQIGQGVDVSKKDSFDLNISRHKDWQEVNYFLMGTILRYLCAYMWKYRFLLMGALSPTVSHPRSREPVTLTPDNFDECAEPYLDEMVRRMYRCGEINLQKYLQGKGGYHHWHSEIYPRDAACETLHRVLLFMYYLNDVDDGGETEFFYQERKITPQAGRLVIAPAGFTHTHKGHIPRSGDKYIATSWILFQRAETIFGQA